MNKIVKEFRELALLWESPKIRAFLLISTFQNLGTGWFFATYVLFLQSHGMSLLQVNLVNAVYMAVDTIFNPYTGRLADKIGQKKIFLAGQLFWFGGMFQYGLASTFWGFVLSEATAAIGSALMSDALESWLRNTSSEEESHEALAHSESFRSIGAIPAAIAGSIIGAKFGLQWPWFAAGITGIIVIALTLKLLWKLPESYGGQEQGTLSVRQVLRTMSASKELRYAALISGVMAMCVQPFNMFWAPIFNEAGGQTEWMGSLWIGISLMSATGSQWARKQANGGGIFKMIMLTAGPMLLTPGIKSITPLTAVFLLHEIGRGAFRPIMFTYANRHINKNYRSTANSILSSVRTAGSTAGLLFFGALTTLVSPVQTWGIAAVMLLILAGYARRKE